MAEGGIPFIGANVHYVAYGTPGGEFPTGVCRAAIITEVDPSNGGGGVDEGRVGLCVLNPTGQFFNRNVPYRATSTPGSWHWPERT
mgnify:CR=1 FL=1